MIKYFFLQERHRTKQLLAAQEILFPNLYNSMMAAMKPIMAINKTGVQVGDILNAKGEEIDDMDIWMDFFLLFIASWQNVCK